MTDGSKLYNYGYIHFSGGMIGENDNTGAQTVVQFGSQASVDISSVVKIQAKVLSSGIINVLNGAKIELRQVLFPQSFITMKHFPMFVCCWFFQ
jgi:hypothetical protein